MQYSTILFDFDGTLTHSLPMWMRAYQFALEQYGINLPTEEVIDRCFYRPWEHVIADFNLPCITEFSGHVHTGLEAAMPEAVLFDDVVNTLEACKKRGIKLGIVTSSTKTVVQKFLTENKMDNYFGCLITADDITNFKPHPEPVFMALDQLQSDAASSLFVGDSSVDMLAAKNAGLHRGLFLPEAHTNYYDFDELRAHGPEFVFHHYLELLNKIELAHTLPVS